MNDRVTELLKGDYNPYDPVNLAQFMAEIDHAQVQKLGEYLNNSNLGWCARWHLEEVFTREFKKMATAYWTNLAVARAERETVEDLK